MRPKTDFQQRRAKIVERLAPRGVEWTARATSLSRILNMLQWQLSSAFTEMLSWWGPLIKCRSKAKKALGPRFNVSAFYDTVLELGSVPIPVLQARIDRFIADGGKRPYPELE